jgi:metal-responsive CopG/Arc/MetJ family transcriptional regulator
MNLCISVPDDLVARLDEVAAAEARTRSNMVRLMVQRQLDMHAELCRDGIVSVRASDTKSASDPDGRQAVETHLQHHAALSCKVQQENA